MVYVYIIPWEVYVSNLIKSPLIFYQHIEAAPTQEFFFAYTAMIFPTLLPPCVALREEEEQFPPQVRIILRGAQSAEPQLQSGQLGVPVFGKIERGGALCCGAEHVLHWEGC